MAEKTPIVREKILTVWDHENDREILTLDLTLTHDWPYWINWLESETTKSFRYIGNDGMLSCTVVKETRQGYKGRSIKRFWYAHRRKGGMLRRKYLGQSENLTYTRLKEVAFELAQGNN